MHKRVRGSCSACGFGHYDIENCHQCRQDMASFKNSQREVSEMSAVRSAALTNAQRQANFRERERKKNKSVREEFPSENSSSYTWRSWWWCIAITMMIYSIGYFINVCAEVFR